jgi:hypothetical protein
MGRHRVERYNHVLVGQSNPLLPPAKGDKSNWGTKQHKWEKNKTKQNKKKKKKKKKTGLCKK